MRAALRQPLEHLGFRPGVRIVLGLHATNDRSRLQTPNLSLLGMQLFLGFSMRMRTRWLNVLQAMLVICRVVGINLPTSKQGVGVVVL